MTSTARRIGTALAILALILPLAPLAGAAPAALDAPADEPWSRPGPGVVANETGVAGIDIYIVRHQAPSLARYAGGVPGLVPTSPDATGATRLDPTTAASMAYLHHLDEIHDELVASIEAELGRDVEVTDRYAAVYNGIAVRMTPDEAAAVSSLPGVRRVTRNYARRILTDAGPGWIGADAIHTGAATPDGVGTLGEGVVVGIIDTGINTDHPSFADVGGDGYDHTNPRGTYLGLCNPVTGLPWCNDKLIGVHDFTGTGPEDGIGHGSHVASTVAGNVVTAEMAAPTTTLTRAISGVAPHANIVSYKACQELTGNCLINGILASINAATLDQVDVINYSIGGSSSNPWADDDAQAFFDAYAAGIFVATSAGNEGPGFGTLGSPADAPWVTTVGASTHDRKLANGLAEMTGGTTPAPADIGGKGITAPYGPARIVYAGDYAHLSNDPDNAHLCGSGVGDPATGEGSGGRPWPPGTFDGEIVVCDRGEYGRVHKGENLEHAGAGGYILANDAANGDSLVADAHALPAVHISFDDGVVLKDWIADGGSDHTATILGMDPDVDAVHGDVMAGFSSRGANPAVPGMIKPDVTAPGVDILAAFHTPAGTLPGGAPEYNIISGTSMSSPHVAGSGALLRAVHPDWSPDELKSALMGPAFTEAGSGPEVHGVLKEDTTTAADPFDMGAGRVDLRESALVGFVLDESAANHEGADPARGGDATTLNVPSLADDFCPTTCSWTRTLTGAVPGTVSWTVSADAPAGMDITVSPSTFTLAEGEQVTLAFTADVSAVDPKDVWTFAEIEFSPDDPGIPTAHFPVAVIPSDSPPPVVMHLHGNLHDGCSGNGAADLAAGGECTPFIGDGELDIAPAAAWGPINVGPDCTVDRCVIDPNWVWHLDDETTLDGVMTVEWWFSGPAVNTLLFDDFEIRLYADGTEVTRTVVRHNVTAPNVPELLRSSIEVPRTTATESFVLVIDPVFANQNGSSIHYDSQQPCPGVADGPACDSRVHMPVVATQELPPQPPRATDDTAYVLKGGTVEVDVLANDTDPEGGPLTVEIVSGPSHGDAVVTADGAIQYTHDGSATASDTLDYEVTDDQGLSDTATVAVAIEDRCFQSGGAYSDDFEEGAPGWNVDTAVITPPSATWDLTTDPFASSGTTVWHTDADAQDPQADTSKDVRLVSPEQMVSSSTRLTFRHRFNTEVGFDGGVLEVSTDGGTTWMDVLDTGAVFASGGYNDLLSPGSGFVLSGRRAWGGESSDFLGGGMDLVEVDLGALAGETIQVRFRFAQDQLTTEPVGGWWIDDVAFSDLLEPCPAEPPMAQDDADVVPTGGSTNTDVLANDSDPDTPKGDLTVTIESAPDHGSAAVEDDGTITYTHDGGPHTSDAYEYRITDPDGLSDVATVTITVQPPADGEGRVHGAGGWDRGTDDKHDKVDFSFDAKYKKDGLGGKLKVHDKDLDVKIDAKEITSLTTGEGYDCDGLVLDGVTSFAFTAVGTFELDGEKTEGARFFACGTDDGAKGKDAVDTLFVTCVEGCDYETGDRVEDAVIDHGNIHLHDPISTGGPADGASDEGEGGGDSTSSDGDAGTDDASSEGEATVVTLDPMLVSEAPAGAPLVITAIVEGPGGFLDGVTVTLRWFASDGTTGEATAVADALGVAVFTATLPDGDVVYVADVGAVASNGLRITAQ